MTLTRKTSFFVPLVVASFGALAISCGSDDGDGSTSGSDAGAATSDAGDGATGAGGFSGADGGGGRAGSGGDAAAGDAAEAGGDSGPDAAPDAASDAEPDAASDAVSDAEPDAEPDAVSDAEPDAASDADGSVEAGGQDDGGEDASDDDAAEVGDAVADADASLECAQGMSDCNGDPSDGCETDTRNDPKNCGACGDVCPTGDHATASCRNGQCEFACVAGFADCDGVISNGCEVNIVVDSNSCGKCGNACGAGRTCANAFCQ